MISLKILPKLFIFFSLITFSLQSLAKDDFAYEDALKSFHNQAYDETIIHLKNALRDNSEHIPSHLLLAKTLIAQGKGLIAETQLNDLQAMGVDFNQLVTLFGEAYILQNKYQKVIDKVTPGYRGNGIEAQIHYLLGQAYLGLHQNHAANAAFTEALLLQKEFPLAKLGLAQVAIKQNKLERAMAYVEDALDSYEPLPNAWILKSMLFQMQGQNQQALLAIEQALKLSPDHMQARLNRASIYLSQNKYLAAQPDVDYILNKIPAEPRAKYLKALINASLGDNKGSNEKLSEIINTLNAVPAEVMQNNPSYFYLAGLTNFQFGNMVDAKGYLRNFLQYKENDFSTLRLLALIEMQQGDLLEAKKLLTKANIYFPNDPNILTLLGMVAMELSDVDTASRYFEQVIKLAPDYSVAHLNLARSDIAAGRYQQAIDKLKSTTKNNELNDEENIEMLLLLIESYLKSKQYSKALPLTQQLITNGPNNSFYYQQYGIALGLSGNIDQAKEALKKAIKLNKNNLQALIHLARIDVVEQNYSAALKKLNTALNTFPNNIVLMVEIADVYTLSIDYNKALIWYEKAFAVDNKDSFALKKLIEHYVSTNKKSKALEVLTNYLIRQPKDNSALIMLGQLHLLMNQPHKAIATFKSAATNVADRTDIYMRLASAQLMIDDRSSAIQSLNKAISFDSERLAPLMLLFPMVLKQGDSERAEQLIYSIEKLTPNKSLTHLLHGQISMSKKDYATAERHYKKAIDIIPSQQAVMGLYSALSAQNKYKLAQALMKNWLKDHPRDVIADISLAESYAQLGNLNKVVDIYEQLLKKYSRMPILLNNAANFLYLTNQKEQALSYAKEAYKKLPTNVDIIDTLAWIIARNGDHQQALPLFRDALVIDFTNPEVKYHLALTLDKENRRNEAKTLLIELVKSDRPFAKRAEAKALLNQWLGR